MADLARYALWFVFIGAVLRPTAGYGGWRSLGRALDLARRRRRCGPSRRTHCLAQTVPNGTLDRQLAFAALGLAVLGLALLEQLLRNSAADARWNARPVCLGLGLTFSFDLFIFSLAALFERSDAELLSVRGLVHALAMPLLAIASRRQADWFDRLHISRAAVFHRPRCCWWGLSADGGGRRVLRSLFGRQPGACAVRGGRLCGAGRIGVACAVGHGAFSPACLHLKNFFSYRYDYREEWLGFNRLLSQGADSQTFG